MYCKKYHIYITPSMHHFSHQWEGYILGWQVHGCFASIATKVIFYLTLIIGLLLATPSLLKNCITCKSKNNNTCYFDLRPNVQVFGSLLPIHSCKLAHINIYTCLCLLLAWLVLISKILWLTSNRAKYFRTLVKQHCTKVANSLWECGHGNWKTYTLLNADSAMVNCSDGYVFKSR